jgi:hypothetical protein
MGYGGADIFSPDFPFFAGAADLPTYLQTLNELLAAKGKTPPLNLQDIAPRRPSSRFWLICATSTASRSHWAASRCCSVSFPGGRQAQLRPRARVARSLGSSHCTHPKGDGSWLLRTTPAMPTATAQVLDLVRASRGKPRHAGKLYRPAQDHVGDRLSASARLLPGTPQIIGWGRCPLRPGTRC